MYQVCSRIKAYRVELLKWSQGKNLNSGKQIKDLKMEMENLSKRGEIGTGRCGLILTKD